MALTVFRGAPFCSGTIQSAAAAVVIALANPAIAFATDPPQKIQGVWEGQYACGQGVTGLALTISGDDVGQLNARFRFYILQQNPRGTGGEFELGGNFNPELRRVELRPSRWVDRPEGYNMVGLQGTLEHDGQTLKGVILSAGCGPFLLTRAGVQGHAAALSDPNAQSNELAKMRVEAGRLNHRAERFRHQGRFAEAEPLYLRSLAIREKAFGPDHPDVSNSLNNLAESYREQGRYAEAEPLLKRALTIAEMALGPNHPDVGNVLGNLGLLYDFQGRVSEAELLYIRALSINENTYGLDHPQVANVLNNLAELHQAQGRMVEAETGLKRSLAIREKAFGADHTYVALGLNNLAGLYDTQGRYDEAEPLLKRSLSIWQKVYGPDHREVGRSLNNLAGLYRTQGRYGEAEQFYKRSLSVWQKGLGPDHPDVGISLDNIAALHFLQSDWAGAASYWRQSTDLVIRRSRRGGDVVGQSLTGKTESEAARLSYRFSYLVKVVHRLAQDDPARGLELSRDMFRMAQWAQGSAAAASLAQMAVRAAKGDPALADFVRERQDLVGEWQGKDKLLIAAKSNAPNNRNADVERQLSDRLGVIDKRIAEIDITLKQKFPDYAKLASPEPLAIADVQVLLAKDEALVLFLDTPAEKPTPDETFIWAVTSNDSRWVRIDLGTSALTDKVQALRCGLNEEEWFGLSQAARCASLLGIDQPDKSDPLPFHLEGAHQVYQALFGQFEDLIKDKRLLIVPSGPLTSLPFHVLVTKKPEAALPKTFEGYRDIPWFGRAHTMTVLPSVSSLKVLRAFVKSSQASKAYIGYGNPVLEGGGDCKEAKAPEKCPMIEVAGAEPRRVAVAEGPTRALLRGRSGRRSPSVTEVFAKGSGADTLLAQVRALCPLPDTAYEIRCVAERLGGQSEIRLDTAATEVDIKGLSESGTLASYRVVQFATHGLLAGDVAVMTQRQGEPALVLTPPKVPKNSDDDGLLTASEVAQLKLNADWIVLSACNTAAGEGVGAAALSGLARAFFYAGARALLVSHWPVYSDAAVRLTTRAFAEMEQDNTVGRAEALQRAMVALMDDTSPNDNAHPSVWAPFVVVGEGAR